MVKDIDKLDTLIAQVWGGSSRSKIPSPPGRECIAEELLEDFLDHKVPQNKIEELKTHLTLCSVCADRLMILKEMRSDSPFPVPARLLNRARDMVQETRPNYLELVLSFAKDVIHILRNSGTLLTPEPLWESVRGEKGAEVTRATDYVDVKKQFGKINVELQIERINGSYKLMVNTLDTELDQPPTNMRLGLFTMDRELNSVEDSEAVFYIKLKTYLIKIIHDGDEIGTVRLDLRKE